MKLAIIINGAGGVGKDTLCNITKVKYKVKNISSIDPIKQAASILGWDGKKSNKDRKFLSDLKKLSIEYNDFPTRYLIEQYNDFLLSDEEIMYIHIREGKEIQHLKELIGGNVITLLVRRNNGKKVYGNTSDDQVEEYVYDYTYDNDLPLNQVKEDYLRFLEKMC